MINPFRIIKSNITQKSKYMNTKHHQDIDLLLIFFKNLTFKQTFKLQNFLAPFHIIIKVVPSFPTSCRPFAAWHQISNTKNDICHGPHGYLKKMMVGIVRNTVELFSIFEDQINYSTNNTSQLQNTVMNQDYSILETKIVSSTLWWSSSNWLPCDRILFYFFVGRRGGWDAIRLLLSAQLDLLE